MLELVEHLEDSYQFVHDRVQEAAYSLIPEERRDEAHLRIGRRLAAYIPPEQREEAIFDIVNQFNRAAALITSRDEREQVAELNLLAGKRARASAAYASALKYLVAGAALQPPDSWERQHAMSFELELHRAECEFLTGALAVSEDRLKLLSARAANTVERARAACLRVNVYTTLDQSERAVEVCLEYLAHLGVEWPPHPAHEQVLDEYQRIWSRLGTRRIEDLIDLPLMSDPAMLGTLDVLTDVVPPALFTDRNLLSLVICRMVNLSLEHGNSDASCFAYVFLGMIAGPHFDNYAGGFQFGRLGYELTEKRGLHRYQARTYMAFGNFVMPWTRHVRTGRDLVRRAFDIANKAGDLTFAAYSCNNLNTNLLAAGDALADAQSEAERGLEFAQKARFGLVIDDHHHAAPTDPDASWPDADIRIVRPMSSSMNAASKTIWQVSGISLCPSAGTGFGSCRRACWPGTIARPSMRRRRRNRCSGRRHHFSRRRSMNSMAGSRGPDSVDSIPSEEQPQHRTALSVHHRQLEIWATHCPENFESRAALVGAEIARIDGRDVKAEQLYEQAIRSAHEQGFVQNEGLAYELAARFYAARGFESIRASLTAKRPALLPAMGSRRQGAAARRAVPAPEEGRTGTRLARHDRRAGRAAGARDRVEGLASGLRARSCSRTRRNRLAHGDRARRRGTWAAAPVARERTPDSWRKAKHRDSSVMVRLCEIPVSATELPESIVRYAARTQESVILDDASARGPFSADEYIRERRPRSVLCLPLIKQGALVALLYLENRLASSVSTRGQDGGPEGARLPGRDFARDQPALPRAPGKRSGDPPAGRRQYRRDLHLGPRRPDSGRQ